MKKIGLLALALVLALGALGVGYAAWTDTIFIGGTVNTGTLDIDVEYVSGTDIYKNTDPQAPKDPVVVFWLKRVGETDPVWQSGTPPTSNYLVASAAAALTGEDTVEITCTDAFPSEDLCADIIVHCVGSVPVEVDLDIDSDDAKLIWLFENGFVTWKAQRVTISDPPGGPFVYTPGAVIGPNDWPVQLHNCEYLKIWLYLDLPQANYAFGDSGYTQDSFMGIEDAQFTAHVYAIQWNEYTSGWWNP
jgi:hypothetical protein